MADESTATKDGDYIVISLLPDVCLTPGKGGYPIPYPIVHGMDQSKNVSKNVFFNGKPAFLHNKSFIDNVKGDEAGLGKGVISQTHMQISHSIDHSESVYINGQAMVRTGDTVWMNWKKP